jgi:hypothetical protein
MRENQFTVTFEIVDARRVRVFVNDSYQGYVRIQQVRAEGGYKLRLTYRSSSSPFKHLISTRDYLDLATETVADLLRHGDIYRYVVRMVISDYLYSYEAADIAFRKTERPKLAIAA